MYQSDSLQIQVVDSTYQSINHNHGLMIDFNKRSQLCIIHLDTHQGGSAISDEGEKRYIHPQFLLHLGRTKNKHAGKEQVLPSLFRAVIVTDPSQNVVHYQMLTISKHIHDILRLFFSD